MEPVEKKEHVEKNMIIGAFVTAGVNMGLEAYYVYEGARTGKEQSGQFPYITLSPYLPPLDDWLAEAGIPLALYLIGKGMKKKSLVEMAKGGAIYGASELIGITTYRIVKAATGPALTYAVVNRRI